MSQIAPPTHTLQLIQVPQYSSCPWKEKTENMGTRNPTNLFHLHDISVVVILAKESYLKMSNSHFSIQGTSCVSYHLDNETVNNEISLSWPSLSIGVWPF